jgi:hypothetical protein
MKKPVKQMRVFSAHYSRFCASEGLVCATRR